MALEKYIPKKRLSGPDTDHRLTENTAASSAASLEICSVHLQIDKAVELGEQYKDLATNDYTLHSVGVDFGFGSSSTAVVLTEFLKEEQKIRVTIR